MVERGFFSEEEILKQNKKFAEQRGEDLVIFDEPLYMSFVVTPEQRAIIEDGLGKCKGKTMTEQLIWLIRKKLKK